MEELDDALALRGGCGGAARRLCELLDALGRGGRVGLRLVLKLGDLALELGILAVGLCERRLQRRRLQGGGQLGVPRGQLLQALGVGSARA